MTESERNEAGLSRNFAFIKQMDQIATQSATSAIAGMLSGLTSRPARDEQCSVERKRVYRSVIAADPVEPPMSGSCQRPLRAFGAVFGTPTYWPIM
jgi:hypothetical protein